MAGCETPQLAPRHLFDCTLLHCRTNSLFNNLTDMKWSEAGWDSVETITSPSSTSAFELPLYPETSLSSSASPNASSAWADIQSCHELMYRAQLYSAPSTLKKDPGRARQKSLATAGTNFTKPGAHNKGDLCKWANLETIPSKASNASN